MKCSVSIAAMAAVCSLGLGAVARADIIDNGIVQLSINDEGNLVQGGVGLTFLPTGGEALAPGCPCEGWGIADITTGAYGMAGETFGDANIASATLTTTGTGTAANSVGAAAVSEVSVVDGDFQVDVTHDFGASASDNLYQVDVTMENVGTTDIGDLVYRRAMDWDVPPTQFSEFVTIQGWPAANLIASSDDGFSTGDPNVPLDSITAPVNSNFVDDGPADHGAAFDFSFGTLEAGGTEDFTIFYGAAASEDDAMMALAEVGAEVFSLGQPSSTDGAELGVPNTYIFAFAGVGGTPVGGPMGHALNAATDFSHLALSHHLENASNRMDQLALTLGRPSGGPVSTRGAMSSVNGLTLSFTGSVQDGSIGATTNNVGYDYNSTYLGVTADYAIPGGSLFQSAVVGAALGYESFSGSRQDGMGGVDGTVGSLSVFAGGTNTNGLFADAQLSFSDLSLDQTRIGTTAVFSSSPNGSIVSGRLRLGYNIGADRLGAGPGVNGVLGLYGEVTRSRTSYDSFTEDNGGVTTAAFSDNANVVALGARYAFQAQTSQGEMFGTFDLAAMVDTMADDFTVTQTTLGGSTFATTVDGRDEVQGRLSASVGMQYRNGWNGSVEVRTIFGGDYIGEVSVGLRVGRSF